MYASVIVDTGGTSSIESLTYKVPDGLAGRIGIGSCVLVPLASRQAVGYVIGFDEETEIEKTRPIIAELDSPVRLSDDTLELARWMSAEYLCPLPRAVMAMLPGVMQCRLQTRVVLDNLSDELPSLGASEAKLFEKIKSLYPVSENGSEDEGISFESLCSGQERAAVQRVLRQLEAKKVARRVYKLLSPSGKPRIVKGFRLAAEASVDGDMIKLPEKQSEVMRVMYEQRRDISLTELTQRYSLSRSAISTLEKKGFLEPCDIVFRRNPSFVPVQQVRVKLSAEQQTSVDEIVSAVDSEQYQGFLLHGVTASGKTEVYLRCIEHALNRGKAGLILLPEIAITTQVMNIFKSRFGSRVAVLHSALSAGERCDEWTRIEEGEAKVVLGARSAVFAPLKNIGIVIVDEEHESSYKQDVQPRYNGRDAAVRRAKESNAALVLGSATPSVESYCLAKKGEYKLLEMPYRVENRPMPEVSVADLREEYAKGKATIFSSKLEQAIRDRLSRREQVILLQNRRAYSTFLLCRDCGFVMRCPNCAVSLKYYSESKTLSCHHCEYTQPAPTVCPSCEGNRIGRFGIGTERVAEETGNAFPEARVLRMDRDTTSHKGAHGMLLNKFRKGEADILVGTQMIAKGLDFPNVTLVGVISADTSINLPDFRASERTFQLISQVAGRAGRGKSPGEVVVQTFDPENYAIDCAVRHDYIGFLEQELADRQELNYPPFSTIVNIVSRDAEEREAESRLAALVTAIKSIPLSARKNIDIRGPQPAVLARLRGEYRWHLVMKCRERHVLLGVVREAMEKVGEIRKHLSVDVDPLSML